MSVVVKYMNYPYRCRQCLLKDLDWERCWGIQKCPILCDLPEKHGNLVDANEVAELMSAYGFTSHLVGIDDLIEDLTVIVEAEQDG